MIAWRFTRDDKSAQLTCRWQCWQSTARTGQMRVTFSSIAWRGNKPKFFHSYVLCEWDSFGYLSCALFERNTGWPSRITVQFCVGPFVQLFQLFFFSLFHSCSALILMHYYFLLRKDPRVLRTGDEGNLLTHFSVDCFLFAIQIHH